MNAAAPTFLMPSLLKSSCFLLLTALTARAAPVNASLRPGLDLNGQWHRIVDPYDTGYYDYRLQPYDAAAQPSGGFFLDRRPQAETDLIEYSFDASPLLAVPGDWNSQDERLLYYEGTVWYRHLFDYTPSGANSRVFLWFGAANYEADVYLNGHKLGHHVGGFTPFAFEATALLQPSGNSLVVRVNNQRRRAGVPTVMTDWWNYGGLTRDVRLVEAPATFIADCAIHLASGARDRIAVRVRLDGAQPVQKITITIPELSLTAGSTTGADGVAAIELAAPGLALWSPDRPKLYTVTVAAETDGLTDEIGFRTIAVRGHDILLNGQPLFLRGICLHEENPLRGGRAFSPADATLLLGWARELNCNFVRLAHYPHNEHMARLADKLGLLLWEEIPVYWAITWDDPDTLANARNQLAELIGRDQNRASVIVWSVANETPVGEARTRFLRTLIDDARSRDGTRLVSAAMEVRTDPADADHKIVDDPLGEFTDLQSFNEYVGWYDGLPEKIARVRWTISRDKPVIISEFGADAVQGMHGGPNTRFSEEYQEQVYRLTLPMLDKIPQFRGCTPWILCDFRSPRRVLPQIQDGWNRKGLIGENGQRKKAFDVLKAYYAGHLGVPEPRGSTTTDQR